MKRSRRCLRWLQRFTVAFVLLTSGVVMVSSVHAQNAQADNPSGTPSTSTTGQGISPAATGPNASPIVGGQPGDYATASKLAVTQISSLLSNLIPVAVTVSQTVMPQANKFAYGLGIITIVLAGLRFAGTHHAITAWTQLFEEIAVLGIFVALYLGYTTSAAGFYTWFSDLASSINGTTLDAPSMLANLAGIIFDALIVKVKAAGVLGILAVIPDVITMIVTFLVMTLTAVVFCYFIALGQIQAAVGIVLGPIALALGFSSYTRGFFQKWLDWMISSGMYVVVVAVLMRLVGASITSALTTATGIGGTTIFNATYCLDLSIFIFLLAFEIPKLAGIFGGGASATGGGGVRVATNAAKLLL
ncbi:TrbL/VirB6 plasmid conjugal transfer protein [Burkholderia sp. D7]|nr:TrbL/VirB6 plasmid conjugal transfer protein [Burkholderia sp. D7]